MLAISNDDELDKMLHGVTIAQGGVMPKILHQLLPKKTEKKSHGSDQNNGGFSQEY